MKGIKGFQKGHETSVETRLKIGLANSRQIDVNCAYCGKHFTVKPSVLKRRKRIFCGRECYARFRSELLPKEEHNAFGTGHTPEERVKRAKARAYFNHYLRDNNLERQPCEICGEKAEAHHDDYDNPLEVRWLCFKHHRGWHKFHDNPELMEVSE